MFLLSFNHVIESIAVLAGFLSVYLTIKQHMLLWFTGLISEIGYLILFSRLSLYGDALLQVLFVLLTLYGWYKWKRGFDVEGLFVFRLRPLQYIFVLCVTLACFSMVSFILFRYTNDAMPYWDAAITVLSIMAQILLCYKLIENWFFWILTDVISIGVYFHKGIYMSSVLYLVFLYLAIVGLYKWVLLLKKRNNFVTV